MSLIVCWACVDGYLVEQIERGAPTPLPGLERPHGSHAVGVADSLVRVQLLSAAAGREIEIGVDGGWRLFEGDPTASDARLRLCASGPDLGDAVAAARFRSIAINGERFACDRLTLVPDRDGSLEVDGRAYRGALVLELVDNRELRAINLVGLEDYVAGVIHAEMPSRFLSEARRAQAVASRTYAVYHTRRGRTLTDDQRSQVYLGRERESRESRDITASTSGQVLAYDGAIFEAYFHSTCGGRTASQRAVFGMAEIPPLSGGVVCHGCGDAPYYRWTRRIDVARIRRAYEAAVPDIASIRPVERDPTGRPRFLALLDSTGAEVYRVAIEHFRRDYNRGQPLSRQLLSPWIGSVENTRSGVYVHGRGFGHGVGLCQYGADGLAREGLGYREILAHYFPGSEIRGATP